MIIRKASAEDAKGIAEIYNYYVDHSIATFDIDHKKTSEFSSQINYDPIRFPWFVALDGDKIVGYSLAKHWNIRDAYRATAETSVYLHKDYTGKGIGKELYHNILEILKNENFHVVIAGISLPNLSSVKFHEDFGFKFVGTYREVGYKFDKWIDVGYWQLHLKKEKKE